MASRLSLDGAVLVALGVDLRALSRSKCGPQIVQLLCGVRAAYDLLDTSRSLRGGLFDPPHRVSYEYVADWHYKERMQMPAGSVLPSTVFGAWVAYTHELRKTLALPDHVPLTAALVTPAWVNVSLEARERDAFWAVVSKCDACQTHLARGELHADARAALVALVGTHTRHDGLVDPVSVRLSQEMPSAADRREVFACLAAVEKAVRAAARGDHAACIERHDREACPDDYLCAQSLVGTLMYEAARGVPAQALAALGHLHPTEPRALVVGTRWLVELVCDHCVPRLLRAGMRRTVTNDKGAAPMTSSEAVALYLMLAAELGPARTAIAAALARAFDEVAAVMHERPHSFFRAPGLGPRDLPKRDDFQPYVTLPVRTTPDPDFPRGARAGASQLHGAAARAYEGHVSLCAAVEASAQLALSLAYLTVPVTHWYHTSGGLFVALAKPTHARPLSRAHAHATAVGAQALLHSAARLFSALGGHMRAMHFRHGTVLDSCPASALCMDAGGRLWLPAWALAPRAAPRAALGYNAMDTFHGVLCLFRDLVGFARELLEDGSAALRSAMRADDIASLAEDASLGDAFQDLALSAPFAGVPVPADAPLDVKGRAHWLQARKRAADTLGKVTARADVLLRARVIASSARPEYDVVDDRADALLLAAAQSCAQLTVPVDLVDSLPIWAAYEGGVAAWSGAAFRVPKDLDLRDDVPDSEIGAVPHFELEVTTVDTLAD